MKFNTALNLLLIASLVGAAVCGCNGKVHNGRTVADIIGDSAGLPRPPAFLDPSLSEQVILESGVNYASGGGGILNETGRPMGCIPFQRVLSTTGKCQERANKLALSFINKAARKLLDDLETELPNASFKFGDAYNVIDDDIHNPYRYGFDNADSPCCSLGRIRPALTCTPASTLCGDRTKYVFWDEYHPSDTANELIAKELIKKFGFMGGKPPTPAPESAIAPSPSDD
ncbi:GDSL esterase/lipase [Hibiscus syriacus]|uniref:GDSL esterase/lipase n=1 Tax=Hibiscus syriacus TaxID=106335 RepID=A0A6A3A7Z5_HIBSY|nr:GDSL esterase/lipase [Hibiscus syriacus]